MKARIIATPVRGYQLEAGDLFSTVGQEYWDASMDSDSIGERVYVRTNAPTSLADDADMGVFKIEIVRGH